MEQNKDLKEKFTNCDGFVEIEYNFKNLGTNGRTLTFKMPKLKTYCALDFIVLTEIIFEKIDEIFGEKSKGDK